MTKTRTQKRFTESAKQTETKQKMASGEIHGEAVSWEANGPHSYKRVLECLKIAGLNDAIAKERAPKHAFTRACRKMSDERIIEKYKEEGDDLHFQFTKAFANSEGIEYKKETNVILDTQTGKVRCKIKEIQELAQKKLDESIEERTTSDISNIIQRLFDEHSDLIPMRSKGGIYFVPKSYTQYTEKIQRFLEELGGRISRWPIASGTPQGDRSIQEAVGEKMTAMTQELFDRVNGFDVHARADSLERAATNIADIKTKIEAYAVYLQDMQEDLLKQIKKADQTLINKVKEIGEHHAENPQGDPERVRGPREGGEAHLVVYSFKQLSSVKDIAKQLKLSEKRVSLHARFWTKKGILEHKDGKYQLAS